MHVVAKKELVETEEIWAQLLRVGWISVGTQRPRSRSEGAVRATLTRTPSASSLLRASRAVFRREAVLQICNSGDLLHVMKDVHTVKCRSASPGETGEPRENLPTSGIVGTISKLKIRSDHARNVPEPMRVWSSAGTKGRGKREIPEKNPPTNSIARPGIEPGSYWWEASRLTAQPPWPPRKIGGTDAYSANCSRTRQQNGVPGQHYVWTPSPNQCLVTFLPADRVHIAVRNSQSDARPRALRSQLQNEHALIRSRHTLFTFLLCGCDLERILLAPCLGEPGSIPGGIIPVFLHVVILPDGALWSAGILGDPPHPTPLHSTHNSRHIQSTSFKTSINQQRRTRCGNSLGVKLAINKTKWLHDKRVKSEEIGLALNIVVLRAGDAASEWRGGGGGRSPRGSADKRHRPALFPLAKSRVTRPGIEPGSPWWEASVLIAQPPTVIIGVGVEWLLTLTSSESTRLNRREYGAASECNAGGKQKIPRKATEQRHRRRDTHM
ncbi:hypothetical protein PR048_001594 [Dryococelus australis]|uniref:Uncharacterized protein n=1 Tax=Dryococelus australis TaxID=614101 RepID=A0ABQ9IHX7_9NEOP|nr:hypothetical protein PR048_001594 [Dryococelus australis]